MTLKRFAALLLSVLMLLPLLPELLPAAQAAPSTDGCTSPNAPNGKHYWGAGNYKDPWCTTPGGTTFRCRYCKKEVFEQSAPALGHNWSAWETVLAPTCTEKGLRTRYCLRCYADEEGEIPALGHSFTKPWTVAKAPTCEDAGQEVNYCVRCNYEWRRPLEAIGHDWDEGKVTKAPTATQDGEKTYTCKNDPSHTKTEVIPATGEDDAPHPTLTLTLDKESLRENGFSGEVYETIPDALHLGDVAYDYFTVKNTGNVDLKPLLRDSYTYNGEKMESTPSSCFVLSPDESQTNIWSDTQIRTNFITPGTETDELLGTQTITFYCIGYDPETGEELCRSNEITRTWKVAKDDGPHPGLHAEWTWADDAGAGKRYEGAEVLKHAKWTNVGDCDLYVVNAEWKLSPSYPTPPAVYDFSSLSFYKLQPGQWLEFDSLSKVTIEEVEKGVKEGTCSGYAAYLDSDNILKGITSNDCPVSIPLTYPDGEEPEEAKPGLTLTWIHDFVCPGGKLIDGSVSDDTTGDKLYDPNDSIMVDFNVLNTGNVPLHVKSYCSFGNGHNPNPNGSDYWIENPLLPGESDGDFRNATLRYDLTPGTETTELLGTVSITIWAKGFDPETDEELCESNKITRTWKVGKNVEPEDLGDSLLSGKLEVRPGYEPSDPAGYQLGEPVSTVLTVENVGPIDLESFTVSDPWDDTTFSDGPIAVSGTKSYIRADVTVTEDDVEKGYIEFPMITIKWTDPDTEKERTTFAGPLTVPVLKKTGLLLKKGYEDPKNGEYFAEGEQIAWTLSVTNNSKESITDVKVDDQGVTVGEYAELKPNDKENCAVPKHTVTEYEAKVVGYVLNSATATGTDYRGATKTWPSNVAKAITKKPTDPGEDPKGDPYGLHPAVSIVKAEDPAGPANGSYYEANEAIKYTITVKNVGDTELKDIAVTDSLAGFAPIGTLPSLAPNEEKTFDYAYTVKEEDIPYQWIYNSATVTYTFGDGVKGTPRTSNTVQSKVGDEPFPPELPHLDPDKLPEGDDWCRLTLESLSENEARYTLHACAKHTEAAMAAEEAAANGDWKAAAAIWEAEVEELYEILYNAADSQLKGALITERAVFYDYLVSFDPLAVDETVRSMRANVDSLYDLLLATADEAKTTELLAEKEKLYADIDASYGGSEYEARANALRLKCAFLCCALHTVPNTQPSSLAGDYAQTMGSMEVTETVRVFGALDGADSEVTETYAGAALKAQNDVIGLLSSAKRYNADDVFARGQQLWQVALDNEVNPVYEAADDTERKLIALWRISLDSLSAAEKPFLELLYAGNDNAIEETLMNLYKDAALITACIK